MLLLPGQRQIGVGRIAQFYPTIGGAVYQTHQAEGAQPVLHRRLPPFGLEGARIGKHTVEMMHRRHVVRMILMIGFGPAHPPDRHVRRGHHPSEIGILAAIAAIALVKSTDRGEIARR